ncbi:hypothetical protein BVX98_06945 [bacterium F11]|nr:hypothetical protein BVX98_06945 [bacterium F11]
MNIEILISLPILIPLTGAAVGIIFWRYQKFQGLFSLALVAISTFISGSLLLTVWSNSTPIILEMGGWKPPYGINLVGDLLSTIMVFMSQIVILAAFLYANGCKDKCVKNPAFYPLFLALTGALTGTYLTGDLFNLFVFTELLVISGAALTALSDDKRGTEAAYKYFYISLLASFSLLMGCGLIYASFGTLNLADLAVRISNGQNSLLITGAFIFILVFFMTKSAIIPFHFWQPDFHTAAPTPVHAVLSSVVVKLGVYGFIRMTTLLFVDQKEMIESLLIITGVLGLFIGGLGATGTFDAKRMLAYSTLSQLGFILIGIGWGTTWSLAAAIIYVFNHSLIKAALLMLAGNVTSRAGVKSAAFKNIQGLGRVNITAGVLFLVGSMALAGLPPTNGFISKLSLFKSGIENGNFFVISMMAIAGLITLIYTTRAFMKIWWDPIIEDQKIKPKGDQVIAPLLLITACIAIGFWSQPLVRLANDTASWLQDRNHYIEIVLNKKEIK